MKRHRNLASLLIALASLASRPAGAATSPPSLAILRFDLVNTSPVPSTPEELARLSRMTGALNAALARSGRYTLVDTGPAAAALAHVTAVRDCNGCERDIARRLGASLVAFGWVQKVSNLILNINLVLEDSATGRHLAAGSVDIRGNTDETWDRGLKFLLEEYVLR